VCFLTCAAQILPLTALVLAYSYILQCLFKAPHLDLAVTVEVANLTTPPSIDGVSSYISNLVASPSIERVSSYEPNLMLDTLAGAREVIFLY